MPKKIKDENGNEVEVYTQEELDKAKEEALNPIKEKLDLQDGEDFNEKLEATVGKAKKSEEYKEALNQKGQGKEKTKQAAQEAMIKQLEEKGVKTKIDDNGNVVIDQEAQNQQPGLTAEQAAAIAKKVQEDSRYEENSSKLLSSLDEDKRGDVEKQMASLKEANISSDADILFNMALAATGVDAPANMNTNMPNNYPNNFPIPNNATPQNRGDFADTPAGKQIMKNLGMSDDLIEEAAKVSEGKERMLKDGKIDPKDGRIANQFDVPSN